MSTRDISDRRAAAQARKIADEQFRTVFDDALIGMALVSPAGAWLRVNDALCTMLGYSRDDLAAMTFQDLTHPDHLGSDLAQVEAVLAGERQGYQMEKRYLRRDGTVVWAALSISLVRAADGTPQHFIAQVQDVSERRRLEAELRNLASLDDLTGLCNRRSFARDLAQQLRLVRRHREPAALLFIDLDGFRAVNDAFGQRTATRFSGTSRRSCAAGCERATPSRASAVTPSRSCCPSPAPTAPRLSPTRSSERSRISPPSSAMQRSPTRPASASPSSTPT